MRGSTASRSGSPAAHPGEHGAHRAGAERRGAARREGGRRGPAPPVGGRRDVLAADHLGRQVARRAHDQPGHREPDVVGHVGDAEVDEHRVAVDEQHVARLDVAVHDPGRVDGVERLGQTGRDPVQVGRRQQAALGHVVVERGAGHVAGDDVGGRAVDVGVDDRGDPRAGDPAQRADLAGQPGPGVGVVGDVLAQHLDRDRAAVPVEREVHHAHPALAERAARGGTPRGARAHAAARSRRPPARGRRRWRRRSCPPR